MKRFLIVLLIFNIMLIASELNSTKIQLNLKITKLSDNTQKNSIEIDKCNIKIDSTLSRINDISSSTDRLSLVVTLTTAFFGILITIIVLILAFKNRSDAKLEAQEAIRNYIEKEAQKFIDKQLKDRTDEYLKIFKEESNEKINNIIYDIDNNNNNIKLSTNDKNYLENQIQLIKLKALNYRNFNDWQKIILYEIANRNYNKALNIINDLTQQFRDNGEQSKLFYLKGIILDKRNQLNEAKNFFEKVLELNPSHSGAYRKLSAIYGLNKDYKKAIDYAKQALKYDPYDYNAYNKIGFYYRKLDNLKKATEYSKKAIELNPDFILPYNNIGTINLHNGKFDEALMWYRKAIKLDNQYANAYQNIFRLNLICNMEFEKGLEKKFIEKFYSDQNNFKNYEMLYIFKDIKNEKNVSEKIKLWKVKYSKFKFRNNYTFDDIEKWINEENNLEIKNNLKKALQEFKNHSIDFD